MTLWQRIKAFWTEGDPHYHCEVYKTEGCAHIDGMHCDLHDCLILQRHRARRVQRLENWTPQAKRADASLYQRRVDGRFYEKRGDALLAGTESHVVVVVPVGYAAGMMSAYKKADFDREFEPFVLPFVLNVEPPAAKRCMDDVH